MAIQFGTRQSFSAVAINRQQNTFERVPEETDNAQRLQVEYYLAEFQEKSSEQDHRHVDRGNQKHSQVFVERNADEHSRRLSHDRR